MQSHFLCTLRLFLAAAVFGQATACTQSSTSARCRLVLPEVREPAPAPFTAEEIRQATQGGRKDRFLIMDRPFPPRFDDIELVAREDGMYSRRLATHEIPVGWTIGGTATIRIQPPPPMTWRDVMGHAAYFDKERAQIVTMPCETALGPQDCVVYVFHDADNEVDIRSYYAKALPGPPVLHTMSVCRELVYAAVLVHHVDGPAERRP
jgi:hypothetical protein